WEEPKSATFFKLTYESGRCSKDAIQWVGSAVLINPREQAFHVDAMGHMTTLIGSIVVKACDIPRHPTLRRERAWSVSAPEFNPFATGNISEAKNLHSLSVRRHCLHATDQHRDPHQ